MKAELEILRELANYIDKELLDNFRVHYIDTDVKHDPKIWELLAEWKSLWVKRDA